MDYSKPVKLSSGTSMFHLEAGPTVFKKAVDYDKDEDFIEEQGPSDEHHDDDEKQKRRKLKKKSHDCSGAQPYIIYPWTRAYKIWWSITVLGASLTIFTETYNIAFASAGLAPFNDGSSIVEFVLVGIFLLDIIVNFNLAHYDIETGQLVEDHGSIAKEYTKHLFWIDFVGVFPFTTIALACAGELGEDSKLAQYLALLRLVRMVRLHRLGLVFEILQYKQEVSLMSLTICRNFTATLVWCHFSACVFFFISRQHDFNPDTTWIGGLLDETNPNGFERYLTSLYFAVVTFTTVGFGDYSPVNAAEQVWGILFMLLNIIFMSWIIGSITMLIVKADEKTGNYRDNLKSLDQFAQMHDLEGTRLIDRLKTQLKLEFNTKENSGEQVLQGFPTAIRTKVLRRLYLPSLVQSRLLNGIRQQFLDAFLALCKVETISPGEDLLQQGAIAADLYFLVDGTVKLIPQITENEFSATLSRTSGACASSVGESMYRSQAGTTQRKDFITIQSGSFVNDISFFTESPQTDTVRTRTVCVTLTLSRSNYKLIAGDYPDAVGALLRNLLAKVKDLRGNSDEDNTTDEDQATDETSEARAHIKSVQQASAILTVEDLIEAHRHKMIDDNTTQFLFAASRGDTKLIAHMCESTQFGDFDPDSADYDRRTAIMVAAMNGQTSTVAKLLEYGVNPNRTDMHGSTALYEAARNGHDDTVKVLLEHGASLCMSEGKAASTLCQAVFDGDVVLLKRLLRAKIDPNAADYDKRTAAHIAAAEGNLAALQILVEHGARVLEARDRWNNSVLQEAKTSKAAQELVDFLEGLKSSS